MDNFLEILLGSVLIAVFLFPVVFALVVATFAAKLFSALFKPITEPIHGVVERVATVLTSPLESSSSFSVIRRYFGSLKNILFICFIVIFLIVHYLSLGDVGNLLENIPLLFPGSALEQVMTYGTYDGTFDISTFFVNPESYLRTIIFSFITGVFVHIGCTTREPNKIHFLVKLLYTLLISLFSSIVLGMIPSDMFHVSWPEISLDFASAGTVTGASDALVMLAQLQEWGGILLEKLVGVIPALVAVYFLCHSVSGFAAAFLGGVIAICSVAMGWPEGLSNPDSPQTLFLLLFILSAGEVIALMFSELTDMVAEAWISENKTLFVYYNVVTLLISYFFYPALAVSVLCLLSLFVNGFDLILLIFGLAALLVFSLAAFAGYKILRWTSKDSAGIEGGYYATAMVFNIPIWIIYIAVFMV